MKVKEFLDLNGIKYQEFDISRDRAAYQEMVSRTGSGAVPQTNINGQVVIGYNVSQLKEKLGIK